MAALVVWCEYDPWWCMCVGMCAAVHMDGGERAVCGVSSFLPHLLAFQEWNSGCQIFAATAPWTISLPISFFLLSLHLYFLTTLTSCFVAFFPFLSFCLFETVLLCDPDWPQKKSLYPFPNLLTSGLVDESPCTWFNKHFKAWNN